jgi:hypothetical protein
MFMHLSASCAIYAAATVALMKTKIEWARAPHNPTCTISIDMERLVDNFFEYYFHDLTRSAGTWIELAIRYLVVVGAPVLYLVNPPRQPNPANNIMIDSYFCVDHTDHCLVTRLLASGIPLTGRIVSGRRMDFATCGEIYLPPPRGLADDDHHFVTLIGAGLRQRSDGVFEICYAVRDSHSIYVHPNSQLGFEQRRGALGGDFQVYARDVDAIWGVNLGT